MIRVTPSLFTEDVLARIREESTKALSARAPGRARKGVPKLSSFPVASSKAQFVPGLHMGFRRGEVTYFLCPFHNEKTPSCVAYHKGRVTHWKLWRTGEDYTSVTRTTHFHCYGCKKTGTHADLARGLVVLRDRIEWGPRIPAKKSFPIVPWRDDPDAMPF